MATAGTTPYEYRIGATLASEDNLQIIIHADISPKVEILPGGRTWPVFSLDEAGLIHVGNVVIDAATGAVTKHPQATLTLAHGIEVRAVKRRFLLQKGNQACTFSMQQLGLNRRSLAIDAVKIGDISFASSPTEVLTLVTQFGPDGKVARYLVTKLNLKHCDVLDQESVGNPDLLLELGYSRTGGWWMTGTIEPTLLHSDNGRDWRKIPLPSNLSSLTSAYVVNKHEIWLAGILASEEVANPLLLVYSSDDGRTWHNITVGDTRLEKMPMGWLEGRKRLGIE